jgi:hypothetical protein
VGEKIIRFNVAEYIDRNLAEMGIDKQNAAKVTEHGIALITMLSLNMTANRAWWRKHEGKIETSVGDYARSSKGIHAPEMKDAASVLEQSQRNLAANFANPYGKIKNEQGVVIADKWTIRPLPPIEETLENLKAFIAERGGKRGLSLGYSQSFIGTGESGPSFYVLNEYGDALYQLSSAYSVREALENAWIEIQQIRKRQ